VSCLSARGGGDRGAAQFKAAYDRFSYTLRASGHQNTLAFELIAKNDKRIAVCHAAPKETTIREMFEPWWSSPFLLVVQPFRSANLA
jgi:hypothetical protein